jgi:Tol biopolymer transport system component
MSPTITTPAMTQAGMILGTAAFMAPEQAKGGVVDRRADVWAFGCVLYEMLSGRQAFVGENVTDTLASVLRAEPDWSALPADTPASIHRLLRRALVKNPRERLADMSTARLEIDEARTGADAGAAPLSIASDGRGRSRARTWAIRGTVALAIAAAAVAGYSIRAPRAEPSRSFSIMPPEGTTFADVARGGAPALSPDGRMVAFVAGGPAGRAVWVQSIDSFDARPLAGTEGGASPFWSPDGKSLGFFAGGQVKKVSLSGGQPQTLGPSTVSAFGLVPGAWNADGNVLFSRGNFLYSVPASGGEATPETHRNIEQLDENHWAPSFLPDGRHYLVLVRGGLDLRMQLCLAEVGSDQRQVIASDVTNAQYAPPNGNGPGYVLFVRGDRLIAQAFDPKTFALSGKELTVAGNVAVGSGGALGDFSVSLSGVLAYRVAVTVNSELVFYDRSGKQTGSIGDRPGNPRNSVRISPDGRSVAFTRIGQSGPDIWIADLAGGGASRFTLNGGRTPAWSPDGQYIAYSRDDAVYRKPVQGGGAEILIWRGPGLLAVNDWSGDSRFLLLTRWMTQNGLNGRGVWLLADPLSDSSTHDVTSIESSGIHPEFVPAIGKPRFISYDRDGQVYVRTMPGGAAGVWQVSTDGGNGTRWRSDGRELYFIRPGYASLAAVSIESLNPFRPGPVRQLFAVPRPISVAVSQYAPGYDVSPDGERFLATNSSADLPSSAIHIVTNWQSQLTR